MTYADSLARRAMVSDRQVAAILADPSHRIAFAKAELRVRGDRYVMTGPTGEHSLAIAYTPTARLNAHWSTFATDPRNAS